MKRIALFAFLFCYVLSCDSSKSEILEDQASDSGAENSDQEIDYCDFGEVLDRCYTGPAGTMGVGACRSGAYLCDSPEVCSHEITPTIEICDGRDNDCDGLTDENMYASEKCMPCLPEEAVGLDLIYGRQCLEGGECVETQCREGCLRCRDGVDVCEGFVGPDQEVCDGIDNNCNGFTDEGLIVEFSCGYGSDGICTLGDLICLQGDMQCVGDVQPSAELCDGLDNDCDGAVDESRTTLSGRLERMCITQCEAGVEFCEEGSWVNCTARNPMPERCNGNDDDCDGLIDEFAACLCQDGQSADCPSTQCAPGSEEPCDACGLGIMYCQDNQWGECQGQIILEYEMCNGIDDDCNGEVDDGFLVQCYTGPGGTAGIGECRVGWQDCVRGEMTACTDEVLPQEEACNGLDDDCDGEIDNTSIDQQIVDVMFLLDLSGSMNACVEQIHEIVTFWLASITGESHRFGVVLFGGQESAGLEEPLLGIQLTDAMTMLNYLTTLDNFNGHQEPSATAVYQTINPAEVLSQEIDWNPSNTPVVVLVTDEQPQLLNGQSADSVMLERISAWVQDCDLPGCNPATNEFWENEDDPLELYIFANAAHNLQWRVLLASRPGRFFPISDSISSLGCSVGAMDALNTVFENICM